MNVRVIIFHLFFILFSLALFGQKKINYPTVEKANIYNIYHGDSIYDPYQWMENLEDPRLKDWLKDQKNILEKQKRQYVNTQKLNAQLYSMYSKTIEIVDSGYEQELYFESEKYQFDYKTVRNDRTPELLFKRTTDKRYRVLFRMRDLRRNKEDNVVVENVIINDDENLAALFVSFNGSDWREVYFCDLIKEELLPEKLTFLQNTSWLVWHGRNVYYDRYNTSDESEITKIASGQKLYFHNVDDPQENDKLVYTNQDTTGKTHFRFQKLGAEKLFLAYNLESRGQFYSVLSTVSLIDKQSFIPKNFLVYPSSQDASFNLEAIFGDTLLLSTTSGAPNGRVVKTNINQENQLAEVIPQFDIPLVDVLKIDKNKVVAIYADKGTNKALVFDTQGTLLKNIEAPEGKYLSNVALDKKREGYLSFTISSFYHPQLRFYLSLDNLKLEPASRLEMPYDPEELETKYVTYTSKDGTEIPMYLTMKKGLKMNGKNPTLIYGYGGYGITLRPNFDEAHTLMILHGGILAVPAVRGSGAKGRDWALEGRRLKKQNTIDDFISAAEYLIENKYTSSEKLALNGSSHGGLIMASVMIQRPELFKTVIAEAGPYDMLRLENYSAGYNVTNLGEFGSVDNQMDFDNLLSYSPLHNVKSGIKYPNLLLITGDNDTRVPPFHTYKFLATLQEKASNESLYHLYIISGTGHDQGQTNADFSDYLMYKYYFLFDQLGIEFYLPR